MRIDVVSIFPEYLGPLELSLVGKAQDAGLVDVHVHDLRRWAHWVTPEVEPRRYDTVFYVAALPRDARARDLSGETTRAEWRTPASALAAAAAGELALMPPTVSVLLELADLPDLEAVARAAQDRVVTPVLPGLRRDRDGWSFVYPTAAGEG